MAVANVGCHVHCATSKSEGNGVRMNTNGNLESAQSCNFILLVSHLINRSVTFDTVRIAVNTRLLLKGKLEGLGRFSYETLKKITQAHPEHEFFFLFDRPFSDDFVFSSNVTPIVVGPPARHPVLWHIWFEISLPRILKKIKPNLFLSPDGFLSLKTNVPSLAVIHDLNFAHNPTDLVKTHAWFYNRYFPKYAKKAVRIATVSEFSKNDIAKQYGISTGKIDVVYNGVSERFSPISKEEKTQVKKQYSDGQPYFVYVGAIHQRKNIERMLLAFDNYQSQSGKSQKMVLVGNKKWWTAEMQSTLDNLENKQDVAFTGRVSDADLQLLIGAATASVYVSTFEGFGIPIIEAFQAEVPVITSNVTSMPEIAGNAALLVNPTDVKEISEAMLRIENSEELQHQLIDKGRQRAKQFTWQRTANLLWKSIIESTQK